MGGTSKLPEDILGADLIWWRASRGWRTVVTVFWAAHADLPQAAYLSCILFDRSGNETTTWRADLDPSRPLFIDSARDGPWRVPMADDAILALCVCTVEAATEESALRYARLFPIVDWISDAGDTAVLHSDQAIVRGREKKQRFTEIVLTADELPSASLVALNGENAEPPGAFSISIRNSAGAVAEYTYREQMAPFTVHQLRLRDAIGNIGEFAAGESVAITGEFQSSGLFSRPYVVVAGERWTAYHSGNVYRWEALPYVAHALIGGEVNPVAVRMTPEVETVANLLHSHGSLETDIWVNASLFDEGGTLVAKRDRWQLARRHEVTVARIADLLPDSARDFTGHIAFSFDAVRGEPVPRRLQALMEYRYRGGTSRTMVWSDEWNSRIKLHKRSLEDPPVLRSYFRVLLDDSLTSIISVTNAGHSNYGVTAGVTVALLNEAGESCETMYELGPYATRLDRIDELFPDSRSFLQPSGLGIVIVGSVCDLANVCFNEHKVSGALSVEHFMTLPTVYAGGVAWPAGG